MYIGLDIGGTKCAAVLGNLAENVEILDKITFATAGKTPLPRRKGYGGTHKGANRGYAPSTSNATTTANSASAKPRIDRAKAGSPAG